MLDHRTDPHQIIYYGIAGTLSPSGVFSGVGYSEHIDTNVGEETVKEVRYSGRVLSARRAAPYVTLCTLKFSADDGATFNLNLPVTVFSSLITKTGEGTATSGEFFGRCQLLGS